MNESFVMRRALENDKLLGFFFAYDFVHKSMFVSYASAPASAHVPKRLWLANADVPIAFYVLDEQIYSLEDFLNGNIGSMIDSLMATDTAEKLKAENNTN